jgi:hypothetical protein
MTTKPPRIPQDLQDWIIARRRHHLSHAHVQMARELGLNPRKLGKLDNHKQQPWKLPLPEFIEEIYARRFGKDRPDIVQSIEERARALAKKAAARREQKRLRREAAAPTAGTPAPEPVGAHAPPSPDPSFDDVPF